MTLTFSWNLQERLLFQVQLYDNSLFRIKSGWAGLSWHYYYSILTPTWCQIPKALLLATAQWNWIFTCLWSTVDRSRPEVTGKGGGWQRWYFSSSQYPLCGQRPDLLSDVWPSNSDKHTYLLSNYNLNYPRGNLITCIKGNKLKVP